MVEKSYLEEEHVSNFKDISVLRTIGHRIAKDAKECIELFWSARKKCEHRSEPTDTETGGCKHKKAYAKHPNLKLAWCDYNVCPIIMAGMKER